MQPAMLKPTVLAICGGAEASSGQVSANQADEPASWSQKHITGLPADALSHILSWLGVDDITRFSNTCRRFRSVVQENHSEVVFYWRLPGPFKSQFPYSRPWLKWMVKNGLHPFTTTWPRKESDVPNGEQKSAVVCFHTLGRMMSTRKYRCTEVFARDWPTGFLKLSFSPSGSNMLLFNTVHEWMCLLNHSGSWSEQTIDRHGDFITIPVGARFSNNGCYLSTFFKQVILIYRRDGDRWKLFKREKIESPQLFDYSPSGKYLVVYSEAGGIERIMCFDDTGYWKSMPMTEAARIKSSVSSVQFSSSEQHMAALNPKKVFILSVDGRGCWISFREIGLEQRINYVQLCPFGRWLLLAYFWTEQSGAFVQMVRLDPAQSLQLRQRIIDEVIHLKFSPGGNYLVTELWSSKYRLFGLDESGHWVLHGNSTGLSRVLSPNLRKRKLEQKTITFSSCDNYLLTSYSDGAVNIWGQDGQGDWIVRGSDRRAGPVHRVAFSQSGVHVLVVGPSSIGIWGRDKDGLWSVKGTILASDVLDVDFHPTAEHLIVCLSSHGIRFLEISEALQEAVRE